MKSQAEENFQEIYKFTQQLENFCSIYLTVEQFTLFDTKMTLEDLLMSNSIVLEPPTNPKFFDVHEFWEFACADEILRNGFFDLFEEYTDLTERYEIIVYMANKFGYSFSVDDVLYYQTYLVYIEYLNQKVFKPMMDLLNHHS